MSDPLFTENQIGDRLDSIGLEIRIIARQLRRLPWCAIQERFNTVLIKLREIEGDGNQILEAEDQIFNEADIRHHASLIEIRREVQQGYLQITNSIVGTDGIQVNGHRYWNDELDSYLNENLEIAYPSKSKDAPEVYAFLSANYYCVAQMVEMGGA